MTDELCHDVEGSAQPICIAAEALGEVSSPAFVVDEALVERNLRVLDRVQRESGAAVVLALKGFAMWELAPLVRKYLPGTTASGLHEAKLGKEKFGGVVHTYGPAYADDEIDEIIGLSDHLSFNSFSQWERFKGRVLNANVVPRCGLRINPEHREVETELYDPCAPHSRLGVTAAHFEGRDLAGITGLHFHTLCELNSDALGRTLDAVYGKFGAYMPGMQWMNFGGGHHITRSDYDVDRLIGLIRRHRERYGHEVILEPGEAVGLNAGVLVATVLDVVHNGMPIAVLDTSATCHMPDVLEMPYRPAVALDDIEARSAGATPHTYRLGGASCLAGDVVGDYAFHRELQAGDRLVFGDMAHYSMVKTTTFNGVRLPAIVAYDSRTGAQRVVRPVGGYTDYRDRLS